MEQNDRTDKKLRCNERGEETSPGLFICYSDRVPCTHCDQTTTEKCVYRDFPSKEIIRGNRRKPKPKTLVVREMTTADRARSLATAVAKWMAAGQPNRTPERVREIFDTICKPCKHFRKHKNPGTGKCGLCTCPVNRKGLVNKLKMATEQCPDDPPKWLSEYPKEQTDE